MQLCAAGAYAASISATTTSTPSICSNDGSLTISASGGTAPYTMTLLSGPSNPNINYPVVLAAGLTTFGGLPSGSYSIQVSDASGNTTTITGSVGGNYTFPSMTFTIGGGTITGTVAGGLGPFQYCLSSTGSNTGFGPYQGTGTFNNLCPGNYWIRVLDSCGNIYTNEVTFTDSITSTLNCVNFSKGTLDVTAGGGSAPYTYSIGGQTNTTGNFTGLPQYFSGTLTITDACGVQYTEPIQPPYIQYLETCPSDSIIYISGLTFPVAPTVLTFTCPNCSPPQSVTLPYDTPLGQVPLFYHQAQSNNYNIIATSTACGGDTLIPAHPHISSNIVLSITYLSCRSFKAIVTNNGAHVNVDSFVLSYVEYGPTFEANTTGLFEDLPDSTYVLTAYIGSLCGDTPRATIVIPYFPAGCYTLMRDPSCHNAWKYSIYTTTMELYSVIFPPADTVPAPAFNRANFYNLAPATTYTLISDSGCAERITTPPASAPTVNVVAYLPCVGQPVIKFTGASSNYCDGSPRPLASIIRIHLTFGDSLIYENDVSTVAPTLVNISGTGYYHYKVYISNLNDTSSALRFDTICPIDTGTVFMNNVQIPYLLSNVGLVCDSGVHVDTLYYQVYGGAAPYTVEIPGFDTLTLQANTGVFPTHLPGTYTMIVYDECGISRSLTFTIVDTCSNCPYAAISLPDTFSCAGDTILLRSASIHAVSYQWYINGQLYSTAKDTSFISQAGSNTIMLRVVSAAGCADTAFAHTTDTCRGCPYAAITLPNTTYCVGDTVHLINASISGVSFLWLINGQPYSTAVDTIYFPPSGANYTVTLIVTSATACVDSMHAFFSIQSPYHIVLPPDTVYCGSFSKALVTGIGSTVWSNGQTGSQIIVTTPGTYTATVSNACGTATATTVIAEKPIPVVNLGHDTLLCEGGSVTLNAGDPGDTYIWSDGATTQFITVHTTGTYSVSVTQNGCVGSDAVRVTFITAPAAFNLGRDTTICNGYPLLLEAYQPNSYYVWNTGSTSPFIYVEQTGVYSVLDSNICGKASDTISITVENCSCVAIIPTAFSPNGDGLNDTYGPIAPCIPENFIFEIFDRWGDKLFTSYSITDRWDGTYKNTKCPLSVYVYTLRYTDPYTHISYRQSGNVTLVR